MSTLNLKEKYERERQERLQKTQGSRAQAGQGAAKSRPQAAKPEASGKTRKAAQPRNRKSPASKASAIDEVYSEDGQKMDKKEFSNITRPQKRGLDETVFKRAALLLLLVILAGLVWGLFLKAPAPASPGASGNAGEADWYAVKLANGEVYYGQITDTSADPVEIENVYYNYDQLNKDKQNSRETGKNLRLVKRGQETHGPSGSMKVVREQVMFMEPLKEDSKVLRAILDYER